MTEADKEALRAAQAAHCPTHWPDEAEIKSWCKLIRPGPKAGWSIPCLILSDWVFEVRTHYAGRTVPCLVRERRCEHCEAGRADRWAGYLAVVRPKGLGPAILELTPGCIKPIQEWCTTHGNLRGCEMVIAREKNKANAAVEITYLSRRPLENGTELQPAFDIKAALWRIWQIKPKTTAAAIAAADPDTLEQMAALKRAAALLPPMSDEKRWDSFKNEDIPQKVNGSR